MKIAEKLKSISFAESILYLSLFFVGIFHVYLSCLLSVVLLVRLWRYYQKNGRLTVRADMTFVAVLVLVVAYGITTFWAVDTGYAIFGLFKFLPLPLYMLLLMQQTDAREQILKHFPFVMGGMTVLSVICMYIPLLSAFFAVSGRLSGFVQYPNTFAVILLIAELLVLTQDELHIPQYVCIAVLLFGILFTGSRTVFVLAGISNIIAFFLIKNKKVRLIAFGCLGVGIIAVLLYCLITDNFGVLTRYLNISTVQSTFVGRLLYAQDALPVILRHPFGLGYMGYYFMQQSVQTGVYAVVSVHNDFLQILLDVGWVPFVLFAVAIVMAFCNKETPLRFKLIFATALLHVCFDFDLQYVAVFMMVLLFMVPKKHKMVAIQNKSVAVTTIAAVLLCGSLYFGTASALARFELHEASTKVYNQNTLSDIELMKKASVAEADEIADRILRRNTHVAVAYSAKSRAAYERGDFAKVIEYKTKTIQTAPFSHVEYWEYSTMLVNGIKLYTQAGDIQSAEFCKQELSAVYRALPAQEENLSRYGAMIQTQPKCYFLPSQKSQIEAVLGGEG